MKSRLQCRLLSKTIKLHVDYVGLKLKVNDSKLTELQMWNRFIQNPEIFFEKVIIQHLSNDSNNGLVLLHPGVVKTLQILGFVNSSFAWDTQFPTALTELCFQGCSLGVCSLGMDDIGEDHVISLPNLKKLFLSSPGNLEKLKDANQETEEYNGISWKIQDLIANLVENSAYLLQKVRSNSLQTICFKFEYIDFQLTDVEPNILVFESLNGFTQAHSETLEILIANEMAQSFSLEHPIPALADRNPSFPSELKCIYYESIPCMADPERCCYIYQAVKGLRKLEEFIATMMWMDVTVQCTSYFSEFLRDICTNNYNGLKFVRITTNSYDLDAVDFSAFGLCQKLEYLYLNICEMNWTFILQNLTFLPASLKVLSITSCSVSGEEGWGYMNYENTAQMKKFSNLVQLILKFKMEFENNNLLLNFTKSLLRLPKLCFLLLSIFDVQPNEDFESYAIFRNISMTLAGEELTDNDGSQTEFRLTGFLDEIKSNFDLLPQIKKGYYALCGYKTSYDKLMELHNDLSVEEDVDDKSGPIDLREVFSATPVSLKDLNLADLNFTRL